MASCSFCGSREEKGTPLCQTCGALRYPVANNRLAPTASKQDKLKLSATVAAAIITPGSFVLLALVGANKLNTKIRKRK